MTNNITKIDIGCGMQKIPTFYGIDKNPNSQADLILDFIKEKLPFDDNSIEEIICRDVIEHITYHDMVNLMNEIWRVLKPNGIAQIDTVYGIDNWLKHPNHVRPILQNQFDYFKAVMKESPTFNNMRESDGIISVFDVSQKMFYNDQVISFKLTAIK